MLSPQLSHTHTTRMEFAHLKSPTLTAHIKLNKYYYSYSLVAKGQGTAGVRVAYASCVSHFIVVKTMGSKVELAKVYFAYMYVCNTTYRSQVEARNTDKTNKTLVLMLI